MEKEEITQGAETQPIKSRKDQFRDRYASRYPDRDFNAENGEDELYDLAMTELEGIEEKDRTIAEYDENNQKLLNIFGNDPRNAAFLRSFAQDPSKSLLAHVVEIYGDEFASALESDEGKKAIADAVERHNEQAEKRKAEEEEMKANFEETLKAYDEFVKSKNLTDEQSENLFSTIFNIAEDARNGIYKPEIFQLIYDGLHYADDVNSAREEGEVHGRNSKIEDKLQRVMPQDNIPPSLSGQGATANENKPAPKTRDSFWDGVKEDGEVIRRNRTAFGK